MNVIDKAKDLLAIESIADEPQKLHEALELIANVLMQDKEVTIERFERNGRPSLLAYYGKKRPERFKALFNGHIDVVPGQPEQFRPYVKDGKLYGRGAADMKVAALIMMEVFLQKGKNLPYSLGLQIVTDEEIGGHNGTKYQIEQGVKADFVIAGEDLPKDTICTEMKGICWVDIVVHGQAAHSGYPWRGDNAIVAAWQYIAKLLEAYPIPQAEQWSTTVNVASISTPQQVYNSVPDEVHIKLDIRYIPEDQRFAARKTAQTFLQQSAPKGSSVDIVWFEPSHRIEAASPELTTLIKAHETTSGQKPQPIKRHGAADVRFYSERGMQAITFGLPDNNAHANDEFVELTSIQQYGKVLSAFLENICAQFDN